MTNIRNIKPRVRNAALALLSSLAVLCLFFAGSDAAALPPCDTTNGKVCYYVAINPIDVCSDTGTNCAPFNNLSTLGNPGAATSTTPIGFVDSGTGSSNTGKDITRAMLNRIGVDIAWGPIRQFNSTKYQTLNVVQCGSLVNASPPPACATLNPTFLTSADFLTLSQQPAISTGPYPITINPPGVPVSSQPTMINMFFVNTLNPFTPGTLYGFSWINNNGIAIGKSTFVPPSKVQRPRPDTIAHELFHNLGGDHTTFGAGPTAVFNLMTAGCCTGTGADLRTEPQSTSSTLTTGALYELAHTTADQLTLTSAAVPPPPNQQDAADASGFLNPIAVSTTSASTPGTGDITTALVVSDTVGNLTTITAAPNSSKPNTSINFSVTGPTSGRPGETLIGLTLTLGKGLHFDPTNRANFPSYVPGNQYVTSFSYDHGNTGDADCPTPATQCLLVQLSGLPESESLFFTQGIVGAPGLVGSSGKTVNINNIANVGATITYKFSDGLIITSDLAPFGCCELRADSQHPSATVPTQIDPIHFTSADGALPCTPVPPPPILIAAPDAVILSCPDPTATPVGDGDVSQEGGQLPPPVPTTIPN